MVMMLIRTKLVCRDEAIAAGFAYLRGKNLVLDDDDSDDDINFADDCGTLSFLYHLFQCLEMV